MGILHDALANIKAKIDSSFDFAEPEKVIAEAETAFKTKVADTVHALEDRVKSIEQAPEKAASAAEGWVEKEFAALRARLEAIEGHSVADVASSLQNVDMRTNAIEAALNGSDGLKERVASLEAHPAVSIPPLAAAPAAADNSAPAA